MYNILLIFPFCSGGKSWRQRALIAIVNVVLMDQRLEPGDFDPFCSRTMDNDDIRLLTVVISGLIEFDEDNILVSILLLQVWQPCLHLWRPGQPVSTWSSFTFTFTFSFTFNFTCGGLVSPCPPGHLSVEKLFHAEEAHYWYHWLHLVKCICFFSARASDEFDYHWQKIDRCALEMSWLWIRKVSRILWDEFNW